MRAELVVEADLGDGSDVIVDRVRVRGDALLRGREVLPGRGEQDPRLVVRIAPIGETPGYTCTVSILDGSGALVGTEATTKCEMCTERELVDHVEKAIDAAVPSLPAQAPDPATTQSPTTTTTAITPTQQDDTRRGLSPIGKAGIGVAVVGLAGAVAGAVLLTRPPKDVDMELETERTSFRTPGIGVLAGGAAVLVVGIALIAVDRARAKKRGTSTASRFGVIRF